MRQSNIAGRESPGHSIATLCSDGLAAAGVPWLRALNLSRIPVRSSLSSVSKLRRFVIPPSGALFFASSPSDPFDRWKIFLKPLGAAFSCSLASTASIIAIVFAAADIVAGAGAVPTGLFVCCRRESEWLRCWRTVGRDAGAGDGLWLDDFLADLSDDGASTLTITQPDIAVSRLAAVGFGATTVSGPVIVSRPLVIMGILLFLSCGGLGCCG
jgi:hypothetical protein